MAIEHKAIQGKNTVRHPTLPTINLRAIASALQYPIAVTGRLLMGSRINGPRGYKQEGFPEHELYQLMSGHRDRMEGYPTGRGRSDLNG